MRLAEIIVYQRIPVCQETDRGRRNTLINNIIQHFRFSLLIEARQVNSFNYYDSLTEILVCHETDQEGV